MCSWYFPVDPNCRGWGYIIFYSPFGKWPFSYLGCLSWGRIMFVSNFNKIKKQPLLFTGGGPISWRGEQIERLTLSSTTWQRLPLNNPHHPASLKPQEIYSKLHLKVTKSIQLQPLGLHNLSVVCIQRVQILIEEQTENILLDIQACKK